ncbi:MAG TPA: hypothetical protein VIT23_06750 [Terrimicrobiaceae bacterium]
MNSRILWISFATVILLIVLIAVGASILISQFLRSEAFRKLMGAKTGDALYSEASYSPLSWAGSSMFVDSFQATGLDGSVVKTLRADQVRADVNWRAILQGAWRVEQIQVVNFDATFRPGSLEPKTGTATHTPPPPRGFASWLPRRFEVGDLDIAKANVRFRSNTGVEIVSLKDSSLDIYPDGTGWAIDGTRGVLTVAKLPALNVVSFHSRTQGDAFFLTDSQFQLGETGNISASGEFSTNSSLRVEWSQVDLAPFLQDPWRSRLSGMIAGTALIQWPEAGIAAGKASGNFRLTEGVAQNLEVLEQVATFTGAPQFRRMPLQELSGNYEWTQKSLRITNLVAESKGLMRLEGTCEITEGGLIAGTLRMGVTPQTLQWLPGSRERVFTVAQNGYVWTDVRIGGSILTPQEDLSARLANALRDEAVHQGRRFIEDLPSAAKDGAKGVLDTLTPLIK